MENLQCQFRLKNYKNKKKIKPSYQCCGSRLVGCGDLGVGYYDDDDDDCGSGGYDDGDDDSDGNCGVDGGNGDSGGGYDDNDSGSVIIMTMTVLY